MVLFELWTKRIPFEDLPPFQVVIEVSTKGIKPNIPEEDNVPPEVVQFMMECLEKDPTVRPDTETIISKVTL